MTTLNVSEAYELLRKYASSNDDWYHHSCAVANISIKIASKLVKAGHDVKPSLAFVGGLLHDIGRSITHHPAMHGWEGYRILVNYGYPEIAWFCLSHVLKGRNFAEARLENIFPEAVYLDTSDIVLPCMNLEAKVVILADILCSGTNLVSVEERYRRSRLKYHALPWLISNERRTQNIMCEIDELLGYTVYSLLNINSNDGDTFK